MANVGADTQTVSREYWERFLQRTVAPEPKSDVKRAARRYPLIGDLNIAFDDEQGRAHTRVLSLINVSCEGLTAKGQTDIALDTDVLIEMNPEGTPFRMLGRIVHCTETIGGYKIGIELQFRS